MPPQTTFESRKNVRVLLRYALCWGLHIDRPDFAKKLAEHGITSARERGTGHVAYATIRSALIWYLGKDYLKLLPAYTIGQGDSTPFEVRMRILKHDLMDLEAAIKGLSISKTTQNDDLEPDSRSTKLSTSTHTQLAGELLHAEPRPWLRSMPDMLTLDGRACKDDTLDISLSESTKSNHQAEIEKKAKTTHFQEKGENTKSARKKAIRRESVSKDLEHAKPLRDHRQKQRSPRSGQDKKLSKEIISPMSNCVHVTVKPLSLYGLLPAGISNLGPGFPLNPPKFDIRKPGKQKRHYVRASVKTREKSVKTFSLHKIGAMDRHIPKITETSSEVISKLIPKHWGELRQTEEFPELGRYMLSTDDSGNTALHYYASEMFFLSVLESLTEVTNHDQGSQDIPKLNHANQSWPFNLSPGTLEHSTYKLRQLFDMCGSGTPWFFHRKHEACSTCTSLQCVKNAPPLALQDSHGQTWLHQYLYHNDWVLLYHFTSRTETGKCLAAELLELCNHYDMDPGVQDNAGRTVLNFLLPHIQMETFGLEMEDTLFTFRDQENGLTEHALASWGVHPTCRIPSWTAWLHEAASQSKRSLDGINFALTHPAPGAEPEPRDLYDNFGNTLLLAFIAFVDPYTMQASFVQKTLCNILSRLPRVDLRDRNGVTPLHLAIKLALPHVAATLLHHIHTHHGSAGSTTASQDVAIQNAIAVTDYEGIALITDLRSTYWKACDSTDDGAIFVEADALICDALVTNAAHGKIFRNFEFRPLRQKYIESNKRTCDISSH